MQPTSQTWNLTKIFAERFDPLDGSSNVDAGIAVGTIFGIFSEGLGEGGGGGGVACEHILDSYVQGDRVQGIGLRAGGRVFCHQSCESCHDFAAVFHNWSAVGNSATLLPHALCHTLVLSTI